MRSATASDRVGQLPTPKPLPHSERGELKPPS
ncbi:MAG: hypothetical protein JWO25_2099, partial [Alphaproteobacteria bacterium]|nr:hypothetical protein [Alphaproteobacteria bacterium]